MPPRTRAQTRHRKPILQKQRSQATTLGELDATPTRPRSQSPPSRPHPDDFEDRIDDCELIDLDNLQHRYCIEADGRSSWLEIGSSMHRSSPVCDGETPRASWKFDEEDSILPFSSPRPGNSNLPDTGPLPADSLESSGVEGRAKSLQRVDFSETASTVRRSSPMGLDLENALRDVWEFREGSSMPTESTNSPSENMLPDTAPVLKSDSVIHLPPEDLYDVTPPCSSRKITKHNFSNPLKPPGDPSPPLTNRKSVLVQSHCRDARSAPGFHTHESVFSKPPSPKSSQNENEKVTDKLPIALVNAQETGNSLDSTRNAGLSRPVKACAAPQQKSGKRRQRVKPTLSFDENTQLIKDKQVGLVGKKSNSENNPPSKRPATKQGGPRRKRQIKSAPRKYTSSRMQDVGKHDNDQHTHKKTNCLHSQVQEQLTQLSHRPSSFSAPSALTSEDRNHVPEHVSISSDPPSSLDTPTSSPMPGATLARAGDGDEMIRQPLKATSDQLQRNNKTTTIHNRKEASTSPKGSSPSPGPKELLQSRNQHVTAHTYEEKIKQCSAESNTTRCSVSRIPKGSPKFCVARLDGLLKLPGEAISWQKLHRGRAGRNYSISHRGSPVPADTRSAQGVEFRPSLFAQGSTSSLYTAALEERVRKKPALAKVAIPRQQRSMQGDMSLIDDLEKTDGTRDNAGMHPSVDYRMGKDGPTFASALAVEERLERELLINSESLDAGETPTLDQTHGPRHRTEKNQTGRNQQTNGSIHGVSQQLHGVVDVSYEKRN